MKAVLPEDFRTPVRSTISTLSRDNAQGPVTRRVTLASAYTPFISFTALKAPAIAPKYLFAVILSCSPEEAPGSMPCTTGRLQVPKMTPALICLAKQASAKEQ